jgi:hypothetical protein
MFDLSDLRSAVGAAANYLLRLLGPGRGSRDAPISLAELEIAANDDLPSTPCPGETYGSRLMARDCVEYYRLDGRPIWEAGTSAND